MNEHRKLSNIRLTRRFHLRYMGLWVLISVLLVALLNVLLYQLLMQMWGYTAEAASDFPGESLMFRRGLIAALGVEGVLFVFALVLLARSTSHRIAGPYLNLEKTCERLAQGERDVRLRFRQYDGLEHLEQTFNAMVDKLSATPPRK